MPDSKKPTLLLIDGHSLAFRAFYALPVDSFVTRDGQHTNAIHGFLSMLNLLLQNERPTHLAVAFDKSRVSFRTEEYPEYKGTRGETPSEFKGQIPLLQEALAAMRVQVLLKDDFEADDVLATLATQGAAQGYRVLVASGDRDTLQLVTDDITVLYPNVRGVSELKTYDAVITGKLWSMSGGTTGLAIGVERRELEFSQQWDEGSKQIGYWGFNGAFAQSDFSAAAVPKTA